tara:strand:- start:477 stop:764 length:288 start_codon:yes stop_codon:yes gene_type:complete
MINFEYLKTKKISFWNKLQWGGELCLLGFMIWMGYSWWEILTMGFLIFLLLLVTTIKYTAVGVAIKTSQDLHNRRVTRDLIKKMKGIIDDTELPN